MQSTRHYMAGMQLYQMDRYEQAVKEFQQHLLAEPNDGSGHAWLSLCFSHLDQHQNATTAAQQAITLAPDEAFSFYALAVTMLHRNRLTEARQAIQDAIRIEPDIAHYHGLQAVIEFNEHKWQAALQAADAGLAHNPEDATCLNIRAQSLTQLGRREEAAQTIQEALAQNPENSYTHANHGWALLHRNQPHEAIKHFSEALRLDPENEFARSGIVEALKARNFLYRGMLAYFLWMGRLPSNYRWGVIMAISFSPMFLARLARANPQLAPYTATINTLILVFGVLTWISDPLFNMVLWFDKWGKHALNLDQKKAAFWLSMVLLPALVAWLLSAITPKPASGMFFLYAIGFGILVLPVSNLFSCDAGWPRRTMWIYVGLLAGIVSVPLFALPILGMIHHLQGINDANQLDIFSKFIILWSLNAMSWLTPSLLLSWVVGMWLSSAKVKT